MSKRQPAPEPGAALIPGAGEPEGAGCVHHWLLSDPANGQVPGQCKRCGEERMFPGSPDTNDRFDDYRELTQSSTYYARERSTA